MTLSRLTKIIAAALVGSTLMTVAAAAAPATATASVNVRTGPGTGFHVVDTLYRGETVKVSECRRGWCHISHRGPDGWVSDNYLRSPRMRPRAQQFGNRWRYQQNMPPRYHPAPRPRHNNRSGNSFYFGFSIHD